MRLSTLAATLVATASLGAYGQEINATYIGAVIEALNAANLTSLAGAAQSVANTTNGAAFLASLPGSNKTLFAPINDAFAGVPEEVSSNATLLADILSYHVLNASVMPSQIARAPAHSVVRSLYNNGMLPGNRSQPVVFSLTNGTDGGNQTAFPYQNNETVYGAGQPVSAANFMIYPIYSVLSLPQTLSEVATAQLPSLAGVISQAGLLEPLEMARGITVFAPNDAALSAAGELLGTLNTTQIQSVLANHVINGTVVYSTLLTASNYTSAGGEAFTFMSNSSGAYVMSGNTTAMIVAADIPIANGVVHVIDRVLANPASNTQAAESAASSYAAEATQTSSAAGNGGGVVGPTSTMGSATGAASGATSAPASGAMSSVPLSFGTIGSAVAIFAGIFAGATLV
ncbi:hypothetical protein NliqN6_5602 [Naganishia liquefaciens]|uniref:FAS1 domain-containing protein n=1 Tax=Naganishia liquefaciens TaxID=104408 RepID=A0A8H3YGT2_9TREE|nr:hypothetical protein NliqN6_5602 [Naganishia liquefaciens]